MQTIRRIAAVTFVVGPSLIALLSAQAPAIAGRITDMSTQPMPGVTVTIIPERGGTVRQATSDRNGTYRFESLPDDTYRIDFQLLGFDLARRNHVRVGSGAAGTVDTVLRVSALCECVGTRFQAAQRAVTGQVFDEANRPLPHATLEVAEGERRETAYADGQGRFLVRVPIDGVWSLTAFDSGFEGISQQLSAASAQPLVFRLRFTGTQDVQDEERLNRNCRCPNDLFTHEGR